MKKITRIAFLICLTLSLYSPQEINAYTWDKIYEARRWGGEAKLVSAAGSVVVNDEQPEIGQVYTSRMDLTIGINSFAFFRMPDDSMFMFKGEGRFSLELGVKVSSLVKVFFGDVTGVKNVESGHFYMLEGAGINFGIKDGVIFKYTVFKDTEEFYFDEQGKTLKRPANIRDHICAIRGVIDYVRTGYTRLEKIEEIPDIKCEYVIFENSFYTYQPGSKSYLRKDEMQSIFNLMRAGIFEVNDLDLDELFRSGAPPAQPTAPQVNPAEPTNDPTGDALSEGIIIDESLTDNNQLEEKII